MATKHMVLSAVGPDRPGLVEAIAALIHDAGGNLEDSRMAILAGDFAQIVLFSGDEPAVERIEQGSPALQRELGLEIRIKQASPPPDAGPHQVYSLEVTGVDQPGIVHRISEVLAGLAVNVASLESRLTPAAFHGTPLFTLQAELQVPGDSDLDALYDRLDEVCRRLNLTYDLTPAPEGESA